MTPRQRFFLNCAIIASFLILPLLLYWDVTVGGRTMLPVDNLFQWEPWRTHAEALGVGVPDNSLLSDLILQNYNWKYYLRVILREGDIPLWNPYLFAGAPFMAAGQNAAYYPFGLLFYLLPLASAYGWYTVSQLWLGGAFMYAFGRALGQRRLSALVAGIIFQGAGFMLVSAAVFPMMIGAAIWLPLILLALEMIVRVSTSLEGAGKTLPWVGLGAFALGMQILAGHIEITYYTLLVMAFYAAWRLLSRVGSPKWRQSVGLTEAALFSKVTLVRVVRPFGWLCASVALGILLGSIQFVPFYEVGVTNFREGSATLTEVRSWGFPVRRVLTFGLPDFFGNPADHFYRDAFTLAREPFSTNHWGVVNPHGAFTSNWGIKNYVEGGVYLGMMSLVLAGLGILSVMRKADPDIPQQFGRRRSAVGLFVVLSLLSLAFIFGTPLYALLYYGLPGINQLHSPFRWVFPLSVAVAVLAGFGMDYVARTRREKELWQARGWSFELRWPNWTRPCLLFGPPDAVNVAASVTFWLGTGILLITAVSWLFYTPLEPLIERVFLGLAQAPDAFPHTRAFYSYQLWNVLHLGLMLTGAGLILRLSRSQLYLPRTQQPLWPFLAIALLIFDLWLVGHGFNASNDPDLLEFRPPLVQWLEEQPDAHLWRLTTFDNKGTKPLNANTAWMVGWQDIRGYDSIIARQYVRYMEAIEPQNELSFNRIQPLGDWQAINSPLLDLLGVKYIITEESLDLPKLALAWSDGTLNVYENLAVMPRAYALPNTAVLWTDTPDDSLAQMSQFDPRYVALLDKESTAVSPVLVGNQPQPAQPIPAEITSYRNREVVIDTAVSEPSWLILNDSYFPGWNAFIRPAGTPDEEEIQVDVVRVNGNFRAVPLPQAGDWTVRFRYSPYTFWLGGLASLMAVVVLVFAFVVWFWRRYYRPQGELTNTRSIAKNSVAPMMLNLFNRGIDFLFAAFYLRLLGPAEAGAFATAIAIAGFYEILSNFGLNAFLIREVSQDKSRASEYLLNTTVLRIFTGVLAAVPIFLYLVFVESNPNLVLAVMFMMGGMVLSGMGQGLTGLFYAHEEAEIPAAVTTVTTILKIGFGVVVLLIGWGFVGLAANSILVNAITLIILLVTVARRYALPGPWRIDWRLQRRMLHLSYPLMLNHLLATVYWQIDVLILSQLEGEAVVGWYNSAYKYINAFNIIPSFFTFALFPVIARQVQSSLEDARRTFRMSAKLLTLISLPLTAVVTLMAPVMIWLLGGQAFLPEGQWALQVTIWSIPFGWLNSVTNYVLISLGQERLQTRAFVAGVTFNIVGNFLLIPYLGFVGAALTTIASEILLLGIFNYYLVKKMPSIGWLNLLWRPVLVTAVMLIAMFGVAQFINLWLGLLVGLIVYPLGLWVLRVFGEEERRILAAILPATVANRLRLLPTVVK